MQATATLRFHHRAKRAGDALDHRAANTPPSTTGSRELRLCVHREGGTAEHSAPARPGSFDRERASICERWAQPGSSRKGGPDRLSRAYQAETTTFAGMFPGQSGSVRTPGVPGKWGRSSPTPWKPRPRPLSLAVDTRGPTHEGIDVTLRDARLALQRCVGRGPIRHFPGARRRG